MKEMKKYVIPQSEVALLMVPSLMYVELGSGGKKPEPGTYLP